MTTALAPARPEADGSRATLVPLAARETRRFAGNPVFLFAVVITAWWTWAGRGTAVADIGLVNAFTAIFLGGFGMMAAFWLTRSMRASEPVVGVTPVTQPERSRNSTNGAPGNRTQRPSATPSSGPPSDGTTICPTRTAIRADGLNGPYTASPTG